MSVGSPSKTAVVVELGVEAWSVEPRSKTVAVVSGMASWSLESCWLYISADRFRYNRSSAGRRVVTTNEGSW